MKAGTDSSKEVNKIVIRLANEKQKKKSIPSMRSGHHY
jgi:hypothetical protein